MHHFIKYLVHEWKLHKFDYILFATAGSFLIISLKVFQGERLVEFLLLLAFTSFYIIWGLYHHIIDNSIHLKIVIEYILIGFTVIFLVKALLFP